MGGGADVAKRGEARDIQLRKEGLPCIANLTLNASLCLGRKLWLPP
jgi:hypothetical protein